MCSGDHFPLEARHHLAPWLDQNFSTDLDLANPQHEEHAQRLVLELVAQLESKVSRFVGIFPSHPAIFCSLKVFDCLQVTSGWMDTFPPCQLGQDTIRILWSKWSFAFNKNPRKFIDKFGELISILCPKPTLSASAISFYTFSGNLN